MAGSDRKRQKKLEQARKKRSLAKKEARQREARFQGASLMRLARTAPFGPAWISASLDEAEAEAEAEGEAVPALLTAIFTRRVRGLLLAELMIIDRTCLGIKNATVTRLMPEAELRDLAERMSDGPDPLRECEPLEVQSVVFHALDYAASLGFSAHEDFESAVLEPRPETLLATPLATPRIPVFISGPGDDVNAIRFRLNQRVGAENYRFAVGGPGGLLVGLDDEEGVDDYEEDDLADDDDGSATVIETTGEPSEA